MSAPTRDAGSTTRAGRIAGSIAAVCLIVFLALYRSPLPWIGFWSLPDVFFFTVAAVAAALIYFLVRRFGRRRALFILGTIAPGVVLVGAAIEIAAQIILRPANEMLALRPDRVLGWRLVPNFHGVWSGNAPDGCWWSREFQSELRTNSLGFHDREHAVTKPTGTSRVALLGDSFVEAVQVPLDATAAQVLESDLNARAAPTARFESLDFGTSCFGIGQDLLAWESLAREFQPDYVAILVAYLHMERTVRATEDGAFEASRAKSLRVRPTFRLEDGALVRVPAADFDAFVQAQDEAIAAFGGSRVRPRARRLALPVYLAPLRWKRMRTSLFALQERLQGASFDPPFVADPATLAVNLRILQTLGRSVLETGARFAIVDACTYFVPGTEAVSDELARLCAANGFQHVRLSDPLLASEARGEATAFRHDGHFNARGNRIFAEALERWIVAREQEASSPAAH